MLVKSLAMEIHNNQPKKKYLEWAIKLFKTQENCLGNIHANIHDLTKYFAFQLSISSWNFRLIIIVMAVALVFSVQQTERSVLTMCLTQHDSIAKRQNHYFHDYYEFNLNSFQLRRRKEEEEEKKAGKFSRSFRVSIHKMIIMIAGTFFFFQLMTCGISSNWVIKNHPRRSVRSKPKRHLCSCFISECRKKTNKCSFFDDPSS